jgi:hypothetical protein
MKWLTALNLQQWAQGIPARTIFPELIGDLIRATAPDVTAFRFPSGDKGQVRGFDGHLRTSTDSTFVPEGDSIWEFGITPAAASKADDDFEKRTTETLESERVQTTFVFATPQTWDNPKKKLDDWVREKNDLNAWREVRYLDGSQLESWLDSAPAVAAYYARSVLKIVTPDGARSIQEYWKEYSTLFMPSLTEDVLLCDRAAQAESLLRGLTGSPDRIVLAADSPEEVVAFAVAAIRKAPPDIRAFLEARTLIVESEEAARYLSKRENLAFLPRGHASNLVGLLAQNGPTLVALGRENLGKRSDTLPRPTGQSLGRAIETMGLSPEEALILARGCGRSVTIIARRIPSGRAQQPTWLQNPRALLPALLAGAWDHNHFPDTEAVAALSDSESYEAIEDRLRLLTRDEDPFIDREGSVWKIRAPVDAFVQLGGHLTRKDFERLSFVVKSVFSVSDDPDEPLLLEPGEHLKRPSQWLREGLATILLQIAVLYEEARLEVPGSTPQRYVNSLIEELPGLRSDPRLLISIRDQLSILAEAAPDPLLAALEQTLEGDTPTARMFFVKSEPMFGPTSPHVYILWALEVLAWDPNFFARSVLILAKLAELDPGMPSGNSPLESLRRIFLLWNPGTNASGELRITVIDRLLRDYPAIGWELIVALLPRSHDHATPTAKPRLREAGASERERVTRRSVWDSQRSIVSRSLEFAGEHVSRWVTVIKTMSNFLPAEREILLQRLNDLLAHSNQGTKNELWRSLRDQLNRHRSFADAAWAIPEPELIQLAELVERYSPQDKIEKIRMLFDEWSPRLGRNSKDDREQQAVERKAALRSIYEEQGSAGIQKLAAIVRLPHLVAENISSVLGDCQQYSALLSRSIMVDELRDFGVSLSAVALRLFGEEWRKELNKLGNEESWPPNVFAQTLLAWPDDDETWDFAQAAGIDVSKAYWSTKKAFHVDGSAETINRAARNYLSVGRSLAAIEALHDRVRDLAPETIFGLLDAAIPELNAGGQIPSGGMLSYYLDVIFVDLQSRSDLNQMEIARREYAFLPLLEHEDRPLVLHKLMAQNADLYVQILSDVFRADDVPSSESTSQSDADKAKASYGILMEFRSVPGEEAGVIDQEVMLRWINEVRKLAKVAKRSEIADVYIGHILAHAAPELGIWPPVPISIALEKLKAPTIEDGIITERYNMRGVVTRAVFEGGEQERELARTHREWLEGRREYPRTAALLGRMADSWDREAELEDTRAEQDKLRS